MIAAVVNRSPVDLIKVVINLSTTKENVSVEVLISRNGMADEFMYYSENYKATQHGQKFVGTRPSDPYVHFEAPFGCCNKIHSTALD